MDDNLCFRRLGIIYLFMGIVSLILISGCINSDEETDEIDELDGVVEDKYIVQKGLVILVNFPDVKREIKKEFVQSKYSQLDEYVREMSYNKVSIEVDITGKWYEMPHLVSYYEISPHNLEVEKSRIENLINDALNAVDKDVNFSEYSFTAIFMNAQREEYGMIGLCGYPGMLGWMEEGGLKTTSGQVVKGGVAIFCYQAHIGTLFHDTAHILGGVKDGKRMVPCLYDHDLQAQPGPLRETFVKSLINMGFWDPMSCHYIEMDIPPPGISSWTKMRLGWMDQSKVRIIQPGEAVEIDLGPLENGKSDILAIKIPISETKYYLLENRQPIGFDQYLPGSGVLIMYADDEIAECRHGKAPVKLMDADPSIPDLKGAAFDVDKKNSFSDEENKLRIQILEKNGDSYKIFVSP